MKRNLQNAGITKLAICLFCVLFMSSCQNIKNKREAAKQEEENEYLMSQITPDLFEPYLVDYAKELCLEKYYRNGNPLWGWVIEGYEVRNEITLQDKSDNTGKTGAGTIHVKMEGAGGKGMRHGSADVYVTGIINIKPDGSYSFVKGSDYNITNVVHLDRIEETPGIIQGLFGN